MSLILDALRKSENSRLRQDHPAIFTAPSRPRPRLPRWVPLVVALLTINLVFIGVVLWRDRSAPPIAAPAAADTPVAAAATSAAGPAELIATAPLDAAATPPLRTATQATETLRGATASAQPTASARPTASAQPMISTRAPSPIVTRDDLLARGSAIPPVDLNMHVYDPNPSVSFVLLNGQRLREGESSREGLIVERITAEGVVLRFGGNSFAVNLQ